jgi:hypothetical protein
MAEHERFVRLERLRIVGHFYRENNPRLEKSISLRRRVCGGRRSCREVSGCDCAAIRLSVPGCRKRSRSAHIGCADGDEVPISVLKSYLGTAKCGHLPDSLRSGVSVPVKCYHSFIGSRQKVGISAGKALRLVIRRAACENQNSEECEMFHWTTYLAVMPIIAEALPPNQSPCSVSIPRSFSIAFFSSVSHCRDR